MAVGGFPVTKIYSKLPRGEGFGFRVLGGCGRLHSGEGAGFRV